MPTLYPLELRGRLRSHGQIRTGNLRRHVVSQAFVAQNGRLTTSLGENPSGLLAERRTCVCRARSPCGFIHVFPPAFASQSVDASIRSVGGARLCRAHFAGEAGASAASISSRAQMLTPFALLRSEVGSTESHPTRVAVASKQVSKIKWGPTSRLPRRDI